MKEIVSTSEAPSAVGAYSQAVVVNNFVFLAGQIPLTPEGNIVDGNIKEQTERCLKNIKAILKETGVGLENVVKATVYLDDIDDFDEMNSVYSNYFEKNPPARSAVEVGEIPKGADIEIEVIAFK